MNLTVKWHLMSLNFFFIFKIRVKLTEQNEVKTSKDSWALIKLFSCNLDLSFTWKNTGMKLHTTLILSCGIFETGQGKERRTWIDRITKGFQIKGFLALLWMAKLLVYPIRFLFTIVKVIKSRSLLTMPSSYEM